MVKFRKQEKSVKGENFYKRSRLSRPGKLHNSCLDLCNRQVLVEFSPFSSKRKLLELSPWRVQKEKHFIAHAIGKNYQLSPCLKARIFLLYSRFFFLLLLKPKKIRFSFAPLPVIHYCLSRGEGVGRRRNVIDYRFVFVGKFFREKSSHQAALSNFGTDSSRRMR